MVYRDPKVTVTIQTCINVSRDVSAGAYVSVFTADSAAYDKVICRSIWTGSELRSWISFNCFAMAALTIDEVERGPETAGPPAPEDTAASVDVQTHFACEAV